MNKFKSTFRRFLKLVFYGISVALFNILLTSFLTELINFYYLFSYVISLTITTVIHFIINTKLIFKTKKEHSRRFLFYLVGLVIFYMCDIILTRTFTDLVALHYNLSILASKTILFFVKFVVYDKLLFKDTSFIFR